MPSYLYSFALVLCLSVPSLHAGQSKTAAAASQAARKPSTPQSPAPPKMPPAQKAVPAKPDYSKEAFVEENYFMKVDFENDGTGTRLMSYRVRIQSDAGVQHYSVVTFPYEGATQTLAIDYVRVRKPDGTVVVTPPDSVQDMPADITRQAPYYSDLREKQVAVKGLSVGDVLEVQAHWQTTKPLAPGQFWFSFNFSHDPIALHEELQISVPKGRAVKWASPGRQPTIAVDGSRQVFTWTSSQLHSKSADEQKKERDEQTYETAVGKLSPPDVRLSSFQSWAEIGAWYNALQRDRVVPDATIRTEAAALTKGATDENAKLRAIYEYVSTQIRYIGVAFGIGRYQPHSAGEILANQYGDCKDKHTLLASLLEAAGIKAYPVLIDAAHKLDPSVPSPDQFDHVITAVPQGNAFVWLDSTAEVAPYGYLLGPLRDKNALLIPDEKAAALVLTPALPPAKAFETFRIDATLDTDGTLKGTIAQTESGNVAEVLLRLAFRNVSMTQWKDLVQRLSYAGGFAGDVSDVTVSSPGKIDQPLKLSYTYTRKDFPQWTQRRIAVALPRFLAATPDEKPSHPILLGDVGEIQYDSQVHLPSGYTPELPANVDLNEDFAEYRATYRAIEGGFAVERTLVVKVPELPASEYEAYKKFSEAVVNDYGLYVGLMPAHVTMASFGMALRALPDSSDAKANTAYNEAFTEAQNRDFDGLTSSLKRAVAIDPKFTRAWLALAGTYAAFRKQDEALAALHSAVANDPKQPLAYKGLGFELMRERKFDEAIGVWKQLIAVAPNDPDGPQYLGDALTDAKRYADAAAAYESAIKQDPKNSSLYTELGSSYLHAGDESKALAAYKKAVELDSSAMSLNNIGYALADEGKELPLALQYTQKAVQQEEEASAKVNLSDLKAEDLYHATTLAAFWDSLGWAYFRTGNLGEAERYLNSAWTLSQAADMGDHLGQVYEKERKKKDAVHTYRMALSASRDPKETISIQVRLGGLGVLVHKEGLAFPGGAELSQMRTFKVAGLKQTTGSADFFLLFAPAPNGSKLEDAKFVSGSDNLKDAGKFLNDVKFDVPFPDDGPERLLRRGILSCDTITHCTFVFYPPESVRSIN